MVDVLILHRHVDHADEGGLRLGLWTRTAEGLCTPDARRPLWELFRVRDGPEGAAADQTVLTGAGVQPP